jgi:hypothetical protein
MEWWIIAALTGVVLLLTKLYRISLRENRELTNYALLILLDEKVHEVQRASLAEFVRVSDAKNAKELGTNVYLATSKLAARLSGNMLGVAGLLWKLKNGSVRP